MPQNTLLRGSPRKPPVSQFIHPFSLDENGQPMPFKRCGTTLKYAQQPMHMIKMQILARNRIAPEHAPAMLEILKEAARAGGP